MATGRYPRFYGQLSIIASYHGSAMSVVMICCRRSYCMEQWMVVIPEEDLVNHSRMTCRNGRASRCRCYALWMNGSHRCRCICWCTPMTPWRNEYWFVSWLPLMLLFSSRVLHCMLIMMPCLPTRTGWGYGCCRIASRKRIRLKLDDLVLVSSLFSI